jgi:hypothetical protein
VDESSTLSADSVATSQRDAFLHNDLQAEITRLQIRVANFDQRLLTIKGWGVTFSLAAIALGFQQNQYGHRPLRPRAVYAGRAAVDGS